MPLSIHHGDIFNLAAEAMIVPGNRQSDLRWGSHIAEQVGRLAAPEVLAQREAAGLLQLGEACLTVGTGTPFPWLIHAAVLDKFDFNPLFLLRLRQRTSDETLRAALVASIALAEAHGIRSLALSAMGSGIGGMPYRRCLRIIITACSATHCDCRFAARSAKQARLAEALLHGDRDPLGA